MPDCYFVWLGKLLKLDAMTVGKISALVSAGFSDHVVVLEKSYASSKAR